MDVVMIYVEFNIIKYEKIIKKLIYLLLQYQIIK